MIDLFGRKARRDALTARGEVILADVTISYLKRLVESKDKKIEKLESDLFIAEELLDRALKRARKRHDENLLALEAMDRVMKR